MLGVKYGYRYKILTSPTAAQMDKPHYEFSYPASHSKGKFSWTIIPDGDWGYSKPQEMRQFFGLTAKQVEAMKKKGMTYLYPQRRKK